MSTFPGTHLLRERLTAPGLVLALIKRIVGRLCGSNAGFGPLQRFFMKLRYFVFARNPMGTRRNRSAHGGRQRSAIGLLEHSLHLWLPSRRSVAKPSWLDNSGRCVCYGSKQDAGARLACWTCH